LTTREPAEKAGGNNVERAQKAHHEANRLLVGAGIILAGAGIPRQAPQMKALTAALRAVNRAGGIEGPRPADVPEKEMIRANAPSENRRFRRAAF
jgi:hypothetical protein